MTLRESQSKLASASTSTTSSSQTSSEVAKSPSMRSPEYVTSSAPTPVLHVGFGVEDLAAMTLLDATPQALSSTTASSSSTTAMTQSLSTLSSSAAGGESVPTSSSTTATFPPLPALGDSNRARIEQMLAINDRVFLLQVRRVYKMPFFFFYIQETIIFSLYFFRYF